jgi:DNA-binding transcriptional MerR regulator
VSGPAEAPKHALKTGQVGERYGVTARTVLRWEADGILPPADLIVHGRRYWWNVTLDRHDRAGTARRL